MLHGPRVSFRSGRPAAGLRLRMMPPAFDGQIALDELLEALFVPMRPVHQRRHCLRGSLPAEENVLQLAQDRDLYLELVCEGAGRTRGSHPFRHMSQAFLSGR